MDIFLEQKQTISNITDFVHEDSRENEIVLFQKFGIFKIQKLSKAEKDKNKFVVGGGRFAMVQHKGQPFTKSAFGL